MLKSQKNPSLPSQIKNLPTKIGVYLFQDHVGKILYVGKALKLRPRVSSYFTDRSHLGPLLPKFLSEIKKITYFVVESEVEALLLEANLIKKYQPFYNSQSKDDKSFLYIKITKEDYSHVAVDRLPKNPVQRKQKEKTAYYFGPYPSAKTVKRTLKRLRRIFPYCSARKIPSKPCFYYGIGLCLGPCGNFVSKNEYRTMINHLKLLLSGKKTKLLRELERDMQAKSKEKQYETAAMLRDQINQIKFLTSAYHLLEEYLKFPELVLDQHLKESGELREILKPYFPKLDEVKKIEAFDISNLGGRLATGSMVVFVDGETEKNAYRHFRIRLKKDKPDDPAMMYEVITRRLKHTEWDFPQLILVDGGKSQVAASLKALKGAKTDIPLVGLAKREERLILKDYHHSFVTVKLPADSKALNLLLRLRDESHRFAISYHKKLRLRDFFDKVK